MKRFCLCFTCCDGHKSVLSGSIYNVFLNHFKCDPETIDLNEVFDDVIAENKDYKLLYSDWPMCESIYLVKL